MEGVLTTVTLLIIFAVSIGTVSSTFWYGLKGGHESVVGDAESTPSVNAWNARADKVAAASQVAAIADVADEGVEEDEEAIKARKREEALARKAARQAKQAD